MYVFIYRSQKNAGNNCHCQPRERRRTHETSRGTTTDEPWTPCNISSVSCKPVPGPMRCVHSLETRSWCVSRDSRIAPWIRLLTFQLEELEEIIGIHRIARNSSVTRNSMYLVLGIPHAPGYPTLCTQKTISKAQDFTIALIFQKTWMGNLH